MDRLQLETKLNRDRTWLLETCAMLEPEELGRGVTASEHDPGVRWSILDHLVHLAGIEQAFNSMIRRHLAGESNPVAVLTNADGSTRSREQIMATVHRANEEYVREHSAPSLSEAIALGQLARSETLALLAELPDELLGEKLPGAPWADGTIGGVLGTNADHGRMHWRWLKDAMPAAGLVPPR
jgi:hypothetical protein